MRLRAPLNAAAPAKPYPMGLLMQLEYQATDGDNEGSLTIEDFEFELRKGWIQGYYTPHWTDHKRGAPEHSPMHASANGVARWVGKRKREVEMRKSRKAWYEKQTRERDDH